MKNVFIPNYLRVVFIMTIVNLIVLFARNKIIHVPIHDSLLLNLFHGFVPLALSYLLLIFNDKINSVFFWIMSLIWVLYYPNSPYMISGLKHISADSPHIQNYDTLIIFSLAVLSLFYGFISLKIMHSLFERRYGKGLANTAIGIALVLSCLGFYMGRVLFLFSGDFFRSPVKIIRETWSHLVPICDNLSTYVLMFLFGGVQLMLLIMFRDINEVKVEKNTASSDSGNNNK